MEAARSTTAVFLAGSIEMGKAEDWQKKLTLMIDQRLEAADNPLKQTLTFLNPRRFDWTAEWNKDELYQDLEPPMHPELEQQITWELNGLERSAVICFFFQPGTISPISLLELGTFSRTHRVVVFCPFGYFRRSNVIVVCRRFNIPMVDSFDDLADKTVELLVKSAESGHLLV